jgi:hypothetical protein
MIGWGGGSLEVFFSTLVRGADTEGAGGANVALFRAVGPAELADIQATNMFRNLGSAEGKYFTTSAEGAAFYAKQAVKGFGDAPSKLASITGDQMSSKRWSALRGSLGYQRSFASIRARSLCLATSICAVCPRRHARLLAAGQADR